GGRWEARLHAMSARIGRLAALVGGPSTRWRQRRAPGIARSRRNHPRTYPQVGKIHPHKISAPAYCSWGSKGRLWPTMADSIRLTPVPDTAAEPRLPRNVEAEAALLGALMVDNRIVEDVQ